MLFDEWVAKLAHLDYWLVAIVTPGSDVWFQCATPWSPLYRPLRLHGWQADDWRRYSVTL